MGVADDDRAVMVKTPKPDSEAEEEDGEAAPAADVDVTPPPQDAMAAKANALSSNTGRFEDRLSAAETENVQLRQLLAQADSYENELWGQFKQYKQDAANAAAKVMGKNKGVLQYHRQIKELEGEVKSKFKKLATQRKQTKAIKMKL